MTLQHQQPLQTCSVEDETQYVEYLVPVELVRDGTQAPWGFRLRGGSDVEGGSPLEIIKVFVGGASEGLLELGDRILSINSHNTTNISHFEAQHLFRTSGTMVQLEVVRLVRCPVPAHRNHSRLQSDIQVSRGGLGFGGTLSPCAPGPAQHPGYVTAAAPHLPAPRHPAAAAKPQESETFKLVLRQEMGTARNQTGISARSFPAPSHASSQASNHCHAPRPVSQLSDTSDTDWTDPLMKNTAINQSSSFKKLMSSMMGDSEF